jgi:hypothetical protein
MGVRIKTISNDIPGLNTVPDNNSRAHQANKVQTDSRQVNKIWELEWEALGKKLNKQTGSTAGPELEKMRMQLKEKDEKLKQAEYKISELKKQVTALQEKQRSHKQQSGVRQPQQKTPEHRPVKVAPADHSTGGHRS